MKNCFSCGTPMNDYDSVCPNCGQNVAQAPQQPQQSQNGANYGQSAPNQNANYGQPAPNQNAYGASYGQPAPEQNAYGASYGQPAPNQNAYGASYGQPAPEQNPYGASYGQAAYGSSAGTNPYGEVNPYGAYGAPVKKSNSKLIIIIVAAVAFVALVIGAIFLFVGSDHSSPENVVEALEDAMNDRDAGAIVDLMAPPELLEQSGVTDEQIDEMGRELVDEMDEEGIGDIDLEYISEEPADESDYEMYKSAFTAQGIEIEKMTKVKVRLNYGTESETENLTMYMVDGDWYIWPGSF